MTPETGRPFQVTPTVDGMDSNLQSAFYFHFCQACSLTKVSERQEHLNQVCQPCWLIGMLVNGERRQPVICEQLGIGVGFFRGSFCHLAWTQS